MQCEKTSSSEKIHMAWIKKTYMFFFMRVMFFFMRVMFFFMGIMVFIAGSPYVN